MPQTTDSVYVGNVRLKTEDELRKARSDARLEAPVEGHFRAVAKRYGCLQRKLTQFYAEDGWPDRLCVWPDGKGTTDWVELKRPKGGKLEPRQKVVIPELQQRGAKVYILKSREEVDEWFEKRARELRVPVPKVKRKITGSKLMELPMPAEVARAAKKVFPNIGKRPICGECGKPMRPTPSGLVCPEGHGGSEVL